MRILGLDFGSKTVGVSVSDPLGITAQGLEIIRREKEGKLRRTLARIGELADSYGVRVIVLGYPKNKDNTIGERARKTEEFKELLEKRTGLSVVLWDERFTTAEADRAMDEANLNWAERKQYVDMLAAQIILQSYLDYLALKREE